MPVTAKRVLGETPRQAGLGFLPMTLVNFVVAMAIPRLRVSGATLLTAGVALTLAGMAWLSRADGSGSYLATVALPMLLIGAGQGLAFAPLTNFGIAGVQGTDAGAASGLLNTAHQLGMALGLGVLVAISAHAGDTAARVSAALTGASGLLAVALVVVVAVIVPSHGRVGRTSTLATAAHANLRS